jgi:uncharacterized phage protein (TIGR01671 family)
MKREIKFRAWDKEKKEIVYDNFSLCSPKCAEFIVWNERNYKNVELMQYTGLKDKNGKEIYEGDIITQKKGNLIAAYNSGGACFCFTKDIKDIDAETYIMGSNREQRKSELANMEVIGNIYENENLLDNK